MWSSDKHEGDEADDDHAESLEEDWLDHGEDDKNGNEDDFSDVMMKKKMVMLTMLR